MKSALRAATLRRLRALDPAVRAEQSRQLCALALPVVRQQLLATPGFVAVFDPFPSEPDVGALSAALAADGVALCTPLVSEGKMVFVDRRRGEASVRVVSPAEIAVCVVPGVAFDRAGRRLGRGGGFYDRFLSDPAFRGRTLALALPEQLVDCVPTDPHDCNVDVVVALP